MSISVYDMVVPSYQQTLDAAAKFLDKAQAHFAAGGVDPQEIVEARLYPDMLPFRFQVRSLVHHSVGALQGIQQGVFSPPGDQPPLPDFAALQAHVAAARDAMQKFTPAVVDAFEAKEVVFQLGDRKLPFTAVNFLLSFSLPNFYFHTATAYDILRSKGVPVGKRDYLGRLRFNAPAAA